MRNKRSVETREQIILRGEQQLRDKTICPLCHGAGQYMRTCSQHLGTRRYLPPDELISCAHCSRTGRIGPYEMRFAYLSFDLNLDNHRLQIWETHYTSRVNKQLLGYRLTAPEGDVIFEGDDFSCGSGVVTDEHVRSLISFLTLRPGDTDAEYFYGYTERQWAFVENEAEALSCWIQAPEHEEGCHFRPLRADDDGSLERLAFPGGEVHVRECAPTCNATGYELADWEEEDEG